MDKLLRNNNVVKIIALLLGIALWFVVNGQTTSPQPYKQPTETYRISEVSLSSKVDLDQYAVVKIPKTVTLELRGTPAALARNISPSDYEVYVDLTNLGKGMHMVNVSVTGFPNDVSVQVIPNRVEVVLEEKQRVEKEVTPKFVGKTPDGYTTGEAIVKPKKVHITLPESQMKEIGSVQAAVNISGAKDVVEQTVPLRVLDKKGNPLDAEINPAVVEVSVPVTSPYKVLPIKLSFVNAPPDGVSIDNIELKTDKVTVYGPKAIIDKMTYYPGPPIDLSTIKENRYMQLKLPLASNVVKTEPDFIELTVRVSKTEKRTFDNLPIGVNGLGQDLKAIITTPEKGSIPLTVKGAPERVSELKADDIQLYVDLSNLPEGEHDVPIHLNLPPFVTSIEDPASLHAVVKIEKAAKQEGQ